MRFHVVTFGCQMNVLDSDWLSRALAARGWRPVAEAEAEVFLVNTCSVRDKPEQKVYSVLGRIAGLLADKPGGFAAVGGCVAQQVGQGLLERFPLVRLVWGTDQTHRVPGLLEGLVAEPGRKLAVLDATPVFEERDLALPDNFSGTCGPRQAAVNIMQGCDNYCAYCIVPFVRGRQKSRHPDAVLSECRALVAAGVREITLLGQNVNSFGLDPGGAGVGFAELLHRVAGIPGLDRLRFTTSHPKDIAPEVVRAFGELPNLCPHLHLPLQSGSDRILRRMGRKYDRARYLDIVAALRAARPDIALGTDLIVGFPGETDEDFEATLEMMERVGFETSFSFCYSDRPGVAAERMTPKVTPETAAGRLARLQNLQNDLTKRVLQWQVGREAEVLVTGPSRRQDAAGPSWQGRDPGNRIVNFPNESDEDLAGRLVRVRVTEAKNHSLMGRRTGATW
ncbi:MAG: tRNA (N6-isopentenyl adenosine(37)-C2)-methylthiotransferase MiaB [Desulfovibrionaceae bacterium]